MKEFSDYDEFVSYFRLRYENTDRTYLNYDIDKDNITMFYCTWHYIDVYKESRNPIKRLFGIKDHDYERNNSGYILNPIVKVRCLCPGIGQVDIDYMGIDGEVYSVRADIDDIFYY